MWSTIVEILERAWRERPRKELIRGLLDLRDAMLRCQESYTGFRSGVSDRAQARILWVRSVQQLAFAVREIDQVLTIFSPKARQHIKLYMSDEMSEAQSSSVLAVAAMDLGSTAWKASNDLGEAFCSALAGLDTFVRENFKPEEIHSAKHGYTL